MRRICAAFVAAMLGVAPLAANEAAEDAGDVNIASGKLAGDLSLVCTALQVATTQAASDPQAQAARAEAEATEAQTLELIAGLMVSIEAETGVSVDEIDDTALAATLQQSFAEAEAADPGAEPAAESWTSFDIARMSLTVLGIADPSGAVSVMSAYTWPVCGTPDAENSVGGFCWKASSGRGAGTIPADFGRTADCPEGFTNNGLTCGRGADSRSAPSRVADCPAGYTNTGLFCTRLAESVSAPSRVADCPQDYVNTGLTCFRPASTYGQASRLADCPADFVNMGASCYRGPDTYGKACTFITKHPCRDGYTDMGCHCQRWAESRSMWEMRCGPGEFRSGGRCYSACLDGYTNLGEFCGREAATLSVDSMTCPDGYFLNKNLGRCYKTCPDGYTNTGEYCHRPVSTFTVEQMTCPADRVLNRHTGRCEALCPEGYVNTGETCFRGVATLGAVDMGCGPGESLSGGRCYPAAACAAATGPNGPGEVDAGLCYGACPDGRRGVGPVCWTACTGKYGFECAAGCATDEAECALATTDMVASPFEMIASFVSLGSYAAAKSARKAATVAAREAAAAAAREGAAAAAQQGARAALRDSLPEALEAAAAAGGREGAEAVGRRMGPRLVEGAKDGALRAKRVYAYFDRNWTAVRTRVLDALFEPIKKAGRNAKPGWNHVVDGIAAGEPQRTRFYKFAQRIKFGENDGNGRIARVFAKYMEIRGVGKNAAARQALVLAQSCAKLGITIDEAALR